MMNPILTFTELMVNNAGGSVFVGMGLAGATGFLLGLCLNISSTIRLLRSPGTDGRCA